MTTRRDAASDTRAEILELVGRYYRERHVPAPFDPERDPVRYAGRVFGEEEMRSLVDSSLDFYLTAGRFTEQFEAGVADYLGLSDALFVNSGSSANLVALTALTSPMLGDRRLQRGDEVITVAAGFPSTVAPIVQNGLVPVFVDIGLGGYNADPDGLRAAISPRTRAIMLAHTLGVPFDLSTVMDLVEKHDLWLVEDNCDALGARYGGRLTGTFGHLATLVVLPRPPHHDRRGRHGRQRSRGPGPDRPLDPRLGPRLLLRRRREQHLRQAVQPAVRQPAVRLRPQVRLQPPRLQPEGDRHAGRHRRRPARAPRRVRRGAQAQPRPAARGAHARTRTGSSCRSHHRRRIHPGSPS